MLSDATYKITDEGYPALTLGIKKREEKKPSTERIKFREDLLILQLNFNETLFNEAIRLFICKYEISHASLCRIFAWATKYQ